MRLTEIIKEYIFREKNNKITELENELTDLKERVDWFISHADIKTLKPATGYLRKKQLDLLVFANEFLSDIAELNIQPFLIGGNLIGAYRHKGYVPWDDDLDFGLIRKDYNALIDYCKKNYHVTVYDGKWSEYNTDLHLKRMNDLVMRYPNEYILDIWVDQLQIMRGTSCIDRLAIDFWSYDYYSDNYMIDDHVEYLKYLAEKKKTIDYVDKIVEFLNSEIIKNDNISKNTTGIVFPGIDSVEGYLRVDRTQNWLKAEDLFPLKKAEYEGSFFYIPNNAEEWLTYEYPDFMSFPTDVGKTPHEDYKEKFILSHLPCVEFYLVDAFEIYHFIPLYNFFEKNGIFSAFVAEKPVDNNAWFDYDEAIKILEYNGLRYRCIPNYNVDFVFTTQGAYLLQKYRGKKIHLCYGVGLTSYSYSEDKHSIDGFDLKIVHGDVSYDIVKNKAPYLDIIKAGYLRYTRWGKAKYIYDSKKRIQSIKSNNCENKPVLLYFPTWDNASSIDSYANELLKLKKDFFIITKAHHCTYRLGSEAKHRTILNNISDVVLEGNFSFEEAAMLGGIAVCDAMSGAATEVPLINNDIKLVLLYSPIAEKNCYKEFINEYACCVKEPEDLINALRETIYDDVYLKKRKQIIHELYASDSENALKIIKTYIKEHCRKKENSHEN